MFKARQYAYVVTQVSARKGELLPRSLFLSLSEAHALDEFTSRLRDTRYGALLAEISAPITAEKLEKIFIDSYAMDIRDVLRHSPNKSRKFLEVFSY